MRLFDFLIATLIAITTLKVTVAASPGAPSDPASMSVAAPAQVVVLGTFHFGNPGLDVANLRVDDVLAPKRQAEIGAVLDDLARYAPTRVLVESRNRVPGTAFSARYRQFLRGEMAADRNEVTQIGFKLAQRLHHDEVYAVDVDGEFPFEAVMAWAGRHGRGAQLEARIAGVQRDAAEMSAQLATHTVAYMLRRFNDPQRLASDHAFYLDLLQYGARDEQPGVALVAGWTARNLGICARIVQLARAGDRLLVLYGSGHAYLLRQCLGAVPGLRVLDANELLRAE